ncbi:hypothetical protein BWD12_05135 [Leptospira santarosai serovar Bananal]|nr:hypothetical protein BV917_03290 [Leptospira santarosai serovar Guaricura]OLY65816.1 hypothetical protein BWD11_00950 [Leptospira santarosai serovar Grippotyphosa]ONF80177.1 hypothetical protein BWD12_05135 [Leptospira santarosai serovar Bananal]
MRVHAIHFDNSRNRPSVPNLSIFLNYNIRSFEIIRFDSGRSDRSRFPEPTIDTFVSYALLLPIHRFRPRIPYKNRVTHLHKKSSTRDKHRLFF